MMKGHRLPDFYYKIRRNVETFRIMLHSGLFDNFEKLVYVRPL